MLSLFVFTIWLCLQNATPISNIMAILSDGKSTAFSQHLLCAVLCTTLALNLELQTEIRCLKERKVAENEFCFL